MSTEKLCPCGKPLHYIDKRIQMLVEQQVEELGERCTITIAESGRKFLVPRHYIGLHGIKGHQLPGLVGKYGIEEVK